MPLTDVIEGQSVHQTGYGSEASGFWYSNRELNWLWSKTVSELAWLSREREQLTYWYIPTWHYSSCLNFVSVKSVIAQNLMVFGGTAIPIHAQLRHPDIR